MYFSFELFEPENPKALNTLRLWCLQPKRFKTEIGVHNGQLQSRHKQRDQVMHAQCKWTMVVETFLRVYVCSIADC